MRLALALALLLVPSAALADAFHGNVALLGGRASGLGGAAVGLPEDDAAPFYNPGAVALDPWVQVSFSAQALDLQQRSFSPYLGSRATETAALLVPNASSGSFPWRGGRASFSAFTTEDESLTLNETFCSDLSQCTVKPGPDTGVSLARIRRQESNVTYQLGPSYGRPINDILSMGISLLYVYQTVSQRADEYAEASNPNATPAAIQHTLDSDSVNQGLAFVGGVRLQPTGPNGRFTFGVTLRSGASLHQDIAVHEQKFLGTRQPDGSLVFNLVTQPPSQPKNSGVPAAAMGGASMRLGGGLVSAQLTVTSASADLGGGVQGKLTVDGAAGAELPIDNGWIARAGVYSRRSSVADPTQAPRIDQYGACLGVGKTDPHHVTDASVVLVHESGQAPVASVTGGSTQANVSGYTLMVTLGGAFRFSE